MTRTDVQQMLNLYIEAEKKILIGQAVDMAGKRLTRADLDSVIKERKNLERRLANFGRKSHSLASF